MRFGAVGVLRGDAVGFNIEEAFFPSIEPLRVLWDYIESTQRLWVQANADNK
jgi:hypothetical protein